MTATKEDLEALAGSDLSDDANFAVFSDALKEGGSISLYPNGSNLLRGEASPAMLGARDRRMAMRLLRFAVTGDWQAFWRLYRKSRRVNCSVGRALFDGEPLTSLAVTVCLSGALLLAVKIRGEAWQGMPPYLAWQRAGMEPDANRNGA